MLKSDNSSQGNDQWLCMFMGPPGAGKGSLSRLLQEKCAWKNLSTGDQLRIHVSKGTDLGKKIDFLLNSGILIPDDVVLEVVRRWLNEQTNGSPGAVLDGFPRTLHQANSFLRMLNNEFPYFKPVVVRLEVPEEVVKGRISSRLTCSNVDCQAVYSGSFSDIVSCQRCGAPVKRRDDDVDESIVERRLRSYREHSKAIADFLRENGVEVVTVNANKALDQVFDDFKLIIGISNNDSC